MSIAGAPKSHKDYSEEPISPTDTALPSSVFISDEEVDEIMEELLRYSEDEPDDEHYDEHYEEESEEYDEDHDLTFNPFEDNPPEQTSPVQIGQINQALADLGSQSKYVQQFLETACMSSFCRNDKPQATKKIGATPSKVIISINSIDLLVAMFANAAIESAICEHYQLQLDTLPYPNHLIQSRTRYLGHISTNNYSRDSSDKTQSDWAHMSECEFVICTKHLCSTSVLNAFLVCDSVTHKLAIQDSIRLDLFHTLFPGMCDQWDKDAVSIVNAFETNIIAAKNDIALFQKKQAILSDMHEHLINYEAIVPKAFDALTLASVSQQGPRVLTLIGPAESGKTTLSHVLSDALNKYYNTEFNVIEYEGSGHIDERAKLNFTGIEKFYTTPQQGDLTYKVELRPDSIIIFKNLNMAHRNVQLMMKEIIEKGELEDITTGRIVSFHNCRIILTFEQKSQVNTQSLSLDLTGASLLKEKSLAVESGLSSALINRQVLTTKMLEEFGMYKLCKMKWQAHLAQNHSHVDYPAYMPALILLASGKNQTPSAHDMQINALINTVKEECLTHVIKHQGEYLPSVKVTSDIMPTKVAFVCEVNRHNEYATITPLVYSSETVVQQPEVLKHCDILAISDCNLELFAALKKITRNDRQLFVYCGKTELSKESQRLFDYSVSFDLSDDVDAFTEKMFAYYAIKHAKHAKKRQLTHELQSVISEASPEVLSINFSEITSTLNFDPALLQYTFFNVCQPTERFSDVFGCADIKQQMTMFINQLRSPAVYGTPPKGILFSGPPGTGKTHFALALAGESELNVLTVNASDLLMGGSEYINLLVDSAESIAPSIVFIDEFDTIGRKRDGQSVGYAGIVNSLLTRMDGVNKPDAPVLFIAATNYPDMIDPALLRAGRFEENVEFRLPNEAERRETIIAHLEKHQVAMLDAKDMTLLVHMFQEHTYKSIENKLNDVMQTLQTQRQNQVTIDTRQIIQSIYPTKRKPATRHGKNKKVPIYSMQNEQSGVDWQRYASECVASDSQFKKAVKFNAIRLAARVVIQHHIFPNTTHHYLNLDHNEYIKSESNVKLPTYEHCSLLAQQLLAPNAALFLYYGEQAKVPRLSTNDHKVLQDLAKVGIQAIKFVEDSLYEQLSNQQQQGDAMSAFERRHYSEVTKVLEHLWPTLERIVEALIAKNELYEPQIAALLNNETSWH